MLSPATHFVISGPSSASAGNAVLFTVTALNSSNGTALTYGGTVQFTSSDGQAMLPADATLTDGTGTFLVVLKTAGDQTVTITDTTSSTITGSATVAVANVAANHFGIVAPGRIMAGVSFAFEVLALDPFGNTVPTFKGAVHLSSSDYQAFLPINGTMTSGHGYFSAVMVTAGNQTLTATDSVTNSLTGTSATITVTPAAANHFAISASQRRLAGNPVHLHRHRRRPLRQPRPLFGNAALYQHRQKRPFASQLHPHGRHRHFQRNPEHLRQPNHLRF